MPRIPKVLPTLLVPVSLLALLTACGDDGAAAPPPPQVTPPQVQPPQVPPPTNVVPLDPNDYVGQQMALRAQQFAEGMTPATALFRGTLQTGATQDYQAVLQGGSCFRIIGVGAQGVTDLDLFLFDPVGAQMLQDTATDAYPILGLSNPICPPSAGAYRVQVKMYAGAGDFGVQVFQAPP